MAESQYGRRDANFITGNSKFAFWDSVWLAKESGNVIPCKCIQPLNSEGADVATLVLPALRTGIAKVI